MKLITNYTVVAKTLNKIKVPLLIVGNLEDHRSIRHRLVSRVPDAFRTIYYFTAKCLTRRTSKIDMPDNLMLELANVGFVCQVVETGNLLSDFYKKNILGAIN